ncbi:MAG TPA: hypothetical protein VM580_00540 [Labilithrix sp.]|jgi:hypothetical protein|nr:hypothetical protein [Labilithrix sp.]
MALATWASRWQLLERSGPQLFGIAVAAALASAWGCSISSDSEGRRGDQGAVGSGADGGASTDASPEDGPGDGYPISYSFRVYDFPEPADDAPCTAASNDSAKIEHVYLAQTHVMEPEWPLFFLVGSRPALLKVNVTGVGASPQVKVEAYLNDTLVGTKCLRGPEQRHHPG